MLTRYPGPNQTVLEAQARVCTGPHRSRPLGKRPGDPDPEDILDLILRTVRQELPVEQRVSSAQMGAFFAAMTLRKGFPERTNWSPAEARTFASHGRKLDSELSPETRFLMNPEGDYTAANAQEQRVVGALRKILSGRHLTYSETLAMCRAILNGPVNPALKAAALIGQRMNLETYEEVKGYLDAVFPPEQIQTVDAPSLTHFGQPYNGSTRYFKPTLFVAAVRAALGEPTVLHGTDTMPPKSGITEEQIIHALGGKTDLPLLDAKRLLEAPDIGFACLSQRMFSPGAYATRELRIHIAKRPPWAATEKAQQFFICPGTNHMVVGYYHAGYEDKFLDLMWDRGLDSGLVIKGEEGTSHFSLRLGKPSDADRKAINHAQGFHRVANARQDFARDIDPKASGFHYSENPRLSPVTAKSFAEAGRAALSGRKDHLYDRIVLNTALTDHLLGLCPDPQEALARTREAIDSGRALAHLNTYLDQTRQSDTR